MFSVDLTETVEVVGSEGRVRYFISSLPPHGLNN